MSRRIFANQTIAKKVKKTGEKKATKKESNALNQLIDKLIGESSTNSESSSTITITVAPQDMEKLETLVPLYQNISAESNNEKTSRDVLRSYYAFGLWLSKQYEYYRKSNPEHTAQARVNDDIKK
ncbi:hypothetical protein F8M41_023601 [Gigaspora margarita]|uniref:Uncharacterized protein n=1 Tax=Gigaspora margarita TaxID=4874 RepID=A0A8H4EGS4_GIGMA|nr:hypothetical protein F8M41_023601 [Gigaspora margarita]